MKFKNLLGSYQAPVEQPEGPEAVPLRPVIYPPGSVFETEVDLLRHNRMGVKKFQRMPDDADIRIAPVRSSTDAPDGRDIATVGDIQDVFTDMTIAELREEASNADIDLGNKTRKRDILKILRSSLTEVGEE